MDKELFIEWKNLDVTKVVFGSIVEKINRGATELSYTAGDNQLQDRFKAGMIHAYRDILEMQFDDTEV